MLIVKAPEPVDLPLAVREGIARRVLKEDPEVAALLRRKWVSRQRARFALGLPSWAKRRNVLSNRVVYDVDPDLFYPQLLDELGFKTPTKYHVEVAFQCMKMDMQVAHGSFGFTIHVRGDNDRKRRWNLTMHAGHDDDVLVATAGLEARAHYLRIRGFLPR